MFCPKCKDEYQEGFEFCVECKEPLVNSIDDDEAETEPAFYVTDDIPALLCTAKDHMESAMIEALMKSNHIPVLAKPRNNGDITMLYMGASIACTNIYVPSKLLARAKELLEPGLYGTAETDGDFDTLKEEYAEKRAKKARWLLLIYMGIPLVPALIAAILIAFLYLTGAL